MTERALHFATVRRLRRLGVLFLHPANGGKRLISEAVALSQMGVQAGVPDLLILTPLPRRPAARGLAIELKGPRGRVSPEQHRWLACLRSAGWLAEVCSSIDQVNALLAETGLSDGEPGPAPVAHGLDAAEAPDAAPEID